MRYVLMILGYGWALIGAGNIAMMPWTEPDAEALLAFGMMFNMFVCVLPGLVVGGIGSAISKNKKNEVAK